MQADHSNPANLSPTNLFQIIEKLKRADLEKAKIPYLKEQLNIFWHGYTHTSVIFPTGWGKFYRAIKYDTKPTHISKLTYPSPDIAKLRRANLAGKPVFYCAGHPKATFFELGPTPGDTVVLSKWILVDEALIFPLGYSAETFKKLNADRGCPIIIPNENKHPKELKEYNSRIDNFFNQQFTRTDTLDREFCYKLTAVIAEQFLKTKPECGIAYPTIAMHANAENFALTPALVDNRLKLESVTWCRIDHVGDFSYTVTLLEYADSFDSHGSIHWRPLREEEKKYLSQLFRA